MANKRDTKLTLADLIAKKAEKEAQKNRTEDVYVESLGGSITIHRPANKIIYQAIDMDNSGIEDKLYANAYLIYHSVKSFQEKELHEAYGVKEPVEVVFQLLEPIEIKEVAEKIMEISGFAKVEQVEKNSKN